MTFFHESSNFTRDFHPIEPITTFSNGFLNCRTGASTLIKSVLNWIQIHDLSSGVGKWFVSDHPSHQERLNSYVPGVGMSGVMSTGLKLVITRAISNFENSTTG